MNKGRRNEYTSTEVFTEEKDLGGNVQRLDLLGHDGECTTRNTSRENDD